MATLSLNVGNFITLRLTPNNYPLWHEQALALAESQELVGHLTNENPAPNRFIIPNPSNSTNADNTIPYLTDAFIAWRKSDRFLRGWIIGTLFEEALGLVLTYFRKEDHTTIIEHIRTFKGLCDNLAAIGKPVPDKEKVFCLLTSLGPQYETFITTMLKPPRPSYYELVSQLQNYDQRRNWFSSHTDVQVSTLSHQVAFYGQQQQQSQTNNSGYRGSTQNFTSTRRGFQAQQSKDSSQAYNSSPTSAQNRPLPPGGLQAQQSKDSSQAYNSSSASVQRRPLPPSERRMTPFEREKYRDQQCQYCGMMGHIAKICWWVPKKSTSQDEIPQALAALTLDNTIADTEWTTDTGASNHMTGKLGTYSVSSTAPCFSPLPQFQDTTTFPQHSMSLEPSPQLPLHIVPQTTTTNIANDFPEFPDSIDTPEISSPHETHTPVNLEIHQTVAPQPATILTELPHHTPTPIEHIHPMVTRSQLGTVKPNPKYALTTITSTNVPREPQNIKTALAHPSWKATINEELAALH
ncbi:hypothetical protein F0562_025550 [Nyssa sinensis]|uniref:CCHC-type domain-containing protein n=1 Tax=Nyssa sinensis TaxID=561372 RepID=A0A5J5B899_9ASTE|nr:hypothetical protein F0562_025550 [Nyssa sinensis]